MVRVRVRIRVGAKVKNLSPAAEIDRAHGGETGAELCDRKHIIFRRRAVAHHSVERRKVSTQRAWLGTAYNYRSNLKYRDGEGLGYSTSWPQGGETERWSSGPMHSLGHLDESATRKRQRELSCFLESASRDARHDGGIKTSKTSGHLL